MKDSQPVLTAPSVPAKYIKVNNERFSTVGQVEGVRA